MKVENKAHIYLFTVLQQRLANNTIMTSSFADDIYELEKR